MALPDERAPGWHAVTVHGRGDNMDLRRGWLALAGMAVGVACAQDVEKDAADALKAFDAKPSVDAMIGAGQALNPLNSAGDGLSAGDIIPRKADPHFDAIKHRLQRGISPAFVDNRPLPNTLGKVETVGPSYPFGALSVLVAAGVLPVVKPSLFHNPDDVLIAGEATPDRLAALSHGSLRIAAFGPARMVVQGNTVETGGAWDVGSFDVVYEHPVYRHSISAYGAQSVARLGSQHVVLDDEDQCSGKRDRPPAEPLDGYPSVRTPVVEYFLAKPRANTAVKITARPRAFTMHALYEGGPTTFHVRVYDIDIDGDGVPDIETLEGDRPGGTSVTVDSRESGGTSRPLSRSDCARLGVPRALTWHWAKIRWWC
jgi:hypothetical protein